MDIRFSDYISTASMAKVTDFQYFASSIKKIKNIRSSLTNQVGYILAC